MNGVKILFYGNNTHILYAVDNYIADRFATSIFAFTAMKVIKNWLVVQVYQGLAQDYLTGMSYQFRAGIKFEPKTGSLVTNGLPGHLQFYSLYEDKLLYNVRIANGVNV